MANQSEKLGPSRKPRVNLKDLKKLIDMMRKAELGEVNIEQEGIKISLKKGFEPQVAALPQISYAPAPPAPASAPPAAAAAEEGGPQITSPMVGTFYRSSSPDAPPYAEVGTRVELGQTVCIIEAMKLMNEIKSEASGVITKILVENAQPVEFGQPLFLIKP
jgi:acetyl-CoA carboxylase biotin carboxyl carrier protein